jgi:hypothetical protein
MTRVNFLDSYSVEAQNIVEKSPNIQKRLSHYHMNWFNYEKLAEMLGKAGFETVYRSAPQRSMFLEMIGPKFDRRPDSLIVEATKKMTVTGMAHTQRSV